MVVDEMIKKILQDMINNFKLKNPNIIKSERDEAMFIEGFNYAIMLQVAIKEDEINTYIKEEKNNEQ